MAFADPAHWSESHVNHWIRWAIKEFQLKSVSPARFAHINGHLLCNMKHSDFARYVPEDHGDTFWTHLELLRKCRFVGKFTRCPVRVKLVVAT